MVFKEDDYFSETTVTEKPTYAEDDYFSDDKVSYSEDDYFKKETQAELEAKYPNSAVLGQAFYDAQKDITYMANMAKPEDSNEMIRNMDAQYTGNSDKVTEFNQYVNAFTPGEKESFESKSFGKPYTDQLDIARKMYTDNNQKKAAVTIESIKNIPENLRRGVVQNIRSVPGVAGNIAQYGGGVSKSQKEHGLGILSQVDPTGNLARTWYGDDKIRGKISKSLTDWGKEKTKKNRLYMETRTDLQPTGEDVVSRFAHGTGSGLVSIAEASAIALATKNPGLAGAVFGAQAAGDTYVNAKEQGLDDETAVKYATIDGVLEAGLESISLSRILKPGVGRSLSAIASSVLTEGSTEGMQELKGNIIRKHGLGMDQDYMDNVVMSIAIGSVLGGGMAVVIPENVKARLDKDGVPEAAQKEILEISKQTLDNLKKKGYTQAEIKDLEAFAKEGLIKPGETEETLKEKPFEDVKPPEEGKFQEQKEAKPSKQLLEIGKARKLIKNYGVDIDKVKGTYEINMPDGKKAAGKYADDLIYVAHVARETTGAHEAFHYLTQKFISDDLYQSALKETGKTGTEADEYLAEEFGNYRNDRKSVTGQIRKLFDQLMRALKRVFGNQKYANKLFNALEKGKGIGVPKMLANVKYQALTPGQKKMVTSWIKQRINKELEAMKIEVKDYKRGRYYKGKTIESEMPRWVKDLGLSSESQALAALKKGNKNFAEAMKLANKRLSEGYSDPNLGYQVPPDKNWKRISEGMKEAIGKEEYKKIAEYAPTKEELRKQELIEKRGEVKKLSEQKQKAETQAKQEMIEVARKQQEVESLKKEAKEKEIATKKKESTIRQEERKKVIAKLKEKQDNAQEFKKEAIEYAKKLPLHERGKLLAQIKNMKTLLDRAKLITYIDRLGAQSQMRTLKANIKKELKKTKTKKQSGKPVGKYTPDIQNILNGMREASILTKTQAQDKIAENMAKYTDQIPPAEIALQNKILSIYGGLDEQTVENLEKGLKYIKDIKQEGRIANELKKLVRGTAIEEQTEEAIKVVTGGKNLPGDYGFRSVKEYEPKTIRDKASVAIRGLGKTMVGYKDILDMLSSLDKDSAPGESALNKIGDVLDEKNAEKKGVKDNMQKVSDMARETLNLKNDSELMDRFNKDMEEKNLGKVKLQTGQEIDLTINKAEARKLYMEFKDETLRDTFDTMGYTDEIRQKINEFLTPQDKAFADAQMEFYQDYYNSINEVYRDVYGVDLPKNEFYSPIRREGIGKEDAGGNEFLQEIALQRSVAPGSIKSRELNTKKIQRQNDVAVIEQHITEMEHFKAWAEKIRDLKSVYGNAKFMDAVAINHDKKLLTILNGFIDSFTANGTEYKNMLGLINKLRVNVAKSVLPLKASIGIKQLTSAPAYADAIPLQHWLKGSFKFWLHPIRNTKMMYESSVLLQNRGKHQERDLALLAKQQKYEKYRKGKNLTEKAMLNVQLGDQGAIVAGGYAVYDYYKNVKGLSHEAAIKKFESVTESTQQSADISEQSVFQRGPLKLFTLFKSSPNQYMRKELQAVRGLLTSRGKVSQHAKTLVIFHLVLPTLFQWVSNGFKWDDDEQKRAAIFGTLNGLFILGDGLDYVLRKLMRMRTWGMSTTVLSIFKDLGDLIGIATKENPKPEDELRMVRKAADVVGKMGGLPVKQLIDMSGGAMKIADGEVEVGLKQLAGFSPYIAKASTAKAPATRAKRETRRPGRSKRKSRR